MTKLKWVHRISNLNKRTLTGDCAKCGPVCVVEKKNGSGRKALRYRCKTVLRELSNQRYSIHSTVRASRSVYLIKADNGLTKIGIAINIKQRFYQLQAASPCHLTLLGSIETNDACGLENSLHMRFSHLRSHSEWFNLSQSDIASIMSRPECKKRLAD